MAKKIKLGIIGGGGDSLIGVLHRIASFMNDNYQIVGAVFNPNWKENIGFAEKIDLPTNRIYKDFESFIDGELALPKSERIEVVSVLTPNFLHFPMAKALLENGFNVICEKPMTTTWEEAKILKNILDQTDRIFAVTYTYTGYPMVRQLKQMIKEGVLGEIQKTDVQYYQGWINPIIHDKELRKSVWRLDPSKGGISCCIGDIGTHAFNMLEYVSGLQVSQLISDLDFVYKDNKMDVDGSVLVRLDNGSKGIIRTSQIATGEENNLEVKIYGKNGALKWRQEQPNELVYLTEGKAKQILTPGHDYNSNLSLSGTKLPPGHPEGIFDAMANIYLGVAKAIRKESYDQAEFPELIEGYRGMEFIEKVVESNRESNSWVKMDNL
ncbi:MAG: Gfo/Idh/MocA family protein [Flavobacteriaceae bacterium]